jgi:malate permease and related proteins
MHVINTLAPVILLISLGTLLRVVGFMPARRAQWVNALTYWVGLPALLFIEIAATRMEFASRLDAIGVLVVVMLLCIGIGYLSAAGLRLQTPATAALVQSGFRGNLAYIGIPVIVYTLGEANKEAIAVGMLLIAATIPFYNIAAVMVLLGIQHKLRLRSIGPMLGRLFTNPLILACAAGLAFAWSGWNLPIAATRTLEPLGRMALPLALLSIGATLDLREVRGRAAPVSTGALIKVLFAPLAGFGLGRAFGVSIEEMRIILLLLACPTAAAAYVMADAMGADSHLTSGIIVLSTILSLLPLFAIAWYFA